MADRTGLILSDLPQILGFSKPMLFAYRAGKNRITPKVWLKLERAEREARPEGGKDDGNGEIAEHDGNLNKSDPVTPQNYSSSVHEDEVPYRFTPMAQQIREDVPPAPSMESVLERIATALERLVEIAERKNTKP